jgi:hypothetical protein
MVADLTLRLNKLSTVGVAIGQLSGTLNPRKITIRIPRTLGRYYLKEIASSKLRLQGMYAIIRIYPLEQKFFEQ